MIKTKKRISQRYLHLFFISLFLVLGTSCKENKEKEIEKIVAEWVGKTIQFPQNVPCTSLGKDTVFPDANTSYKILLYTDSIGCISCKLQLAMWRNYIEDADSTMPNKVRFLFYFQPKNSKEFSAMLKYNKFKYPSYIDPENKINIANKFPLDMNYQCFLLDENNKVVMIGNPTLNPNMWNLYKQVIMGKENISDNTRATTVEIDQSEIELKNLKKGETTMAIFTLRNTGEKPLVINDIATSCGCTVAERDEKPINPGESTQVKVKVTPDNTGYFTKTITVFCNTRDSSIQLTVKGVVGK